MFRQWNTKLIQKLTSWQYPLKLYLRNTNRIFFYLLVDIAYYIYCLSSCIDCILLSVRLYFRFFWIDQVLNVNIRFWIFRYFGVAYYWRDPYCLNTHMVQLYWYRLYYSSKIHLTVFNSRPLCIQYVKRFKVLSLQKCE